MKNKALLAGLIFALTSATANASTIPELWGRGTTESCQYYTQTTGDFEVRLRADDLPWGTRVFVVHGFGEATPLHNWLTRAETEAHAIAPYTWSAQITQILHFRSSPQVLGSIQLFFRIELPDGSQRFVRSMRGDASGKGYLEAHFDFVGSSPCIGRNGTKPSMQELILISTQQAPLQE